MITCATGRPGILQFFATLEAPPMPRILNTANLPIVALPAPPRRCALERITKPPPGTAREPAPRFRVFPAAVPCAHRRHEESSGTRYCADCGVLEGFIGSVCSPGGWRRE